MELHVRHDSFVDEEEDFEAQTHDNVFIHIEGDLELYVTETKKYTYIRDL